MICDHNVLIIGSSWLRKKEESIPTSKPVIVDKLNVTAPKNLYIASIDRLAVEVNTNTNTHTLQAGYCFCRTWCWLSSWNNKAHSRARETLESKLDSVAVNSAADRFGFKQLVDVSVIKQCRSELISQTLSTWICVFEFLIKPELYNIILQNQLKQSSCFLLTIML